MTRKELIPVKGTQRRVWPGASPVAETLEGNVLLTAWLHPRRGGELDVARAQTLGATPPSLRSYADRATLRSQTNADPADIALLRRYCAEHGIDVLEEHWRSVVMSASISKFIEAFGATAGVYELGDKRRFRHRSGSLHAPADVAAILRGPFGIHQWPRSHAVGTLHSGVAPLMASEIAVRYRFPDADGAGQTVGVLQMRGAFNPDDFARCMQAQGVTAKTPVVKRVDNAELTHEIETAKDVESAIDTQIVGALAPGAQIVVYATPDDERGVLDAIRTALFDEEYRPSILSISFGFPEQLWTPVALSILDELFAAAALLGVSIFCASGDHGAEVDAEGKPHVLAPASSPFALGCGGTRVTAGADAAAESGWENSGGGFSAVFGAPSWQSAKDGRGVPDVAAQVSPGYAVFFEGAQLAMGGTSAAAPMWAALTARLNQRLGTPAGFFAPLLYGAAPGSIFSDVLSGGNDRYRCAAGWNACTGLGVPIGDAIENTLRGPKA
ncbi:MAG TPA: S53 family peptidase [Candidatus Babeliales bacterium]|nr:S53 family peptidase [Candidatus Babeliales bacterium]